MQSIHNLSNLFLVKDLRSIHYFLNVEVTPTPNYWHATHIGKKPKEICQHNSIYKMQRRFTHHSPPMRLLFLTMEILPQK